MYALHPQLADETVPVCDLDLCRVLLSKDATYPWLVLSPRREGLRDLHDLSEEDGITALEEIRRCSRALVDLFRPDKMNVAALGNQVPQLHVHIIARFATDPAWPGPVWGKVPAAPYDDGKRPA
ncbi:MAG: HIT domain-containing protein [Rhodospirillaceae bacterium]|nr:HIT domain-containing protein [Rhodospirillaceae bacterium]MYB13172.1 HIT domain-containing protein [Rhodospirillaceae bacterium]MYI47502.1 HIT domain-containing protein [Rhodospirillaceae bacterium]